MLEVQNLIVKIQGRLILDRFSLRLDRGRWFFLMGENGVGKSTLLRSLIGTNQSQKGQVFLDGQDTLIWSASDRAQKILKLDAEVKTEFPILVREYLELAKRIRSGPFQPSAYFQAIQEAMGERMLNSLSGGETQKVMLARAEIQDPEVLLLDETFSRMDLPGLRQAAEWVRAWLAKGKIVFQVTHDPYFAKQNADEVVWLAREKEAVFFKDSEIFDQFLREQYRIKNTSLKST